MQTTQNNEAMIYDFSWRPKVSLGLIAQKQVSTIFQEVTELRPEKLKYEPGTSKILSCRISGLSYVKPA